MQRREQSLLCDSVRWNMETGINKSVRVVSLIQKSNILGSKRAAVSGDNDGS